MVLVTHEQSAAVASPVAFSPYVCVVYGWSPPAVAFQYACKQSKAIAFQHDLSSTAQTSTAMHLDRPAAGVLMCLTCLII
jgi:hypothetical protein